MTGGWLWWKRADWYALQFNYVVRVCWPHLAKVPIPVKGHKPNLFLRRSYRVPPRVTLNLSETGYKVPLTGEGFV